jgi:hypothetical protein
VPDAIDVVSFDAYQKDTYEVTIDRSMMEHWVYPALKPHQKVMIVTGLYGDISLTGAAHDAWEKQLVDKLNGDWQWAKADKRVIGINPCDDNTLQIFLLRCCVLCR